MLAVSGELNRELGGIPAHPEINEEVAMQPRHIMGSVGPAYQADPLPSQRNRRTIYAERIRPLARLLCSGQRSFRGGGADGPFLWPQGSRSAGSNAKLLFLPRRCFFGVWRRARSFLSF